MGKKYPLEPLRSVRVSKVLDETRRLADAVREVDRKAAERAREEAVKSEAEARARAEASSERAHLEDGALSVADLARGAAWGIGVALTRERHARSVEQARAAHGAARSEADLQRGALASAQAGAEAVDRDRDRWAKGEEQRRTAAEDEAAEEVHLARRRGSP